MTECQDALYFLEREPDDSTYLDQIWEGYAADFTRTVGTHTGGFAAVLEALLKEGYELSPGPYAIVRLDRSISEDASPIIAWVGTLNDDLSISEGFSAPKVPLLTRWPPK